jgi:hypothetical protein
MENLNINEIFNNIKDKEKLSYVSYLFILYIFIIVKSVQQKYINSSP